MTHNILDKNHEICIWCDEKAPYERILQLVICVLIGESKGNSKDFTFIEYSVSIVLIITSTSHNLYGLDFA